MARITQGSVDQVKAAADMLDVVGARTQLKKAGARYTGRCPFHEERTPSFSVNALDKLYYCFGCGKGGDLISFVRETENLDFTGAIEWLAERFRVPLEYEESSPAADAARKRRERLFAVLEQAAVVLRAVSVGGGGGRGCARVSRRAWARRAGLQRVPARTVAARRPSSRGRRLRRASTAPSWRPPGSSTAAGTTTSPDG